MMASKLTLEELSRQPLVVGTMSFTDPTGTIGFKTEQLQVSALVRIAAALERQTARLEGWISVSERLPAARPDASSSWAVLAAEYTGSQVIVTYNHASRHWEGLDYVPRITHWQPLPESPKLEGGPADG